MTILLLQPPSPASWGRRFAAFILDLVFGAVGWFVALIVLALFSGDGEVHLSDGGFFLFTIAVYLLWEIAWLVGPVDAKPGQRMLGLRVVATDGSAVGVVRVLVRSVAKIFGITIGFALLASAVTIAATQRRQALHDLVAGTMVVHPRGPKPDPRTLATAPASATLGVPGSSTIDSPPIATQPDAERHRGPFM